MGHLELLVGGHVLGVGQLPVEGHDWSESFALGNQTQLAWSEVVVLAVTLHLCLLNEPQRFLEQVLNGQLHHGAPDCFSVVEYARVLLLLLCAVEEAPHEADHQVLENPLEDPPQDPVVLVLEVPGILLVGRVLQPLNFVGVELVQQRDPGEHLESVELDKLSDFLVEDLLVLTFEEAGWEDLSYELRQEIGHLSVGGFAQSIQVLENLAPLSTAKLRLFQQLCLFLLPISRQRAIFTQIVVVIELLLIVDDLDQHLDYVVFDLLAHASEAKHLLVNLVCDLLGGYFAVEHMLLEEGVLAVHMGAVEQPVAVDDILPVVLPNVVGVVVLLVLDIVLVTLDIFANDLSRSRQLLARRAIILEPQDVVLSFRILFIALVIWGCFDPLLVVKGLVQPTELVVEVNEDIGARDLDK